MNFRIAILIIGIMALFSNAFSISLISDGSFEENCATSSCTYNSTQLIGDDWNYTTAYGSTNLKFIIDQNAHSTEGAYVGAIRHTIDTNHFYEFILNKQLLQKGTVYFDITTIGGDSDVDFRVKAYDPTTDLNVVLPTRSGGSGTLNVMSAGTDYNVTLPFEQQYVFFSLRGFGPSGKNDWVQLDNIRYSTFPSLVNNISESKDPVSPDENFYIYDNLKDNNGTTITNADVNIIFNGIEYDKFDYNSSAGKYTWSHSEANIGTYEYTVKASKPFYTSDSDSGTIVVSNPYTNCIPVIYNGEPLTKIDIVFNGSGFPDMNSFRKAVDFAINYGGDENGLMSFEPFKTYKNKFNVWMTNKLNTYQALPNQNGWGFEDSSVGDAQKACPWGNEFIVLSITPRVRAYALPPQILSGDPGHRAYVTLGCEFLGTCPFPIDADLSNPYSQSCQGNDTNGCSGLSKTISDLQRTLPHEFGHSFGGLVDEYDSNQSINFESGKLANCDHINYCPKWNSIPGTLCIPNCGYKDWYRAYPETLMRGQLDPREEFKEVNENELEKDILTYSDPGTIITDLAYLIRLNYQNGAFYVIDFNLVQGVAPENNDKTNTTYKTKIISSVGENLYDFNFDIPNNLIYEPLADWFDANGNQIFVPANLPVETINDLNFTMVVPYNLSGSQIKILDNNGITVVNIDTSNYLAKINYILENGGKEISSQNYSTLFTISSQPTVNLNSQNYNVKLGWSIYDKNQ